MVTSIPQTLFIYGTLQAPEVLEAVTGRAFASEPARLEGFRRFGVPGQVYPGIVPDPQGVVVGFLILQVDPVSWSLMDRFEHEYERRTVMVHNAQGELEPAETYVWKGKPSDDLWDMATFRAKHLRKYLENIE